MRLHVFDLTEVAGHVCGKNHLNDEIAKLPVLLRLQVTQDVLVFLTQQSKQKGFQVPESKSVRDDDDAGREKERNEITRLSLSLSLSLTLAFTSL